MARSFNVSMFCDKKITLFLVFFDVKKMFYNQMKKTIRLAQ